MKGVVESPDLKGPPSSLVQLSANIRDGVLVTHDLIRTLAKRDILGQAICLPVDRRRPGTAARSEAPSSRLGARNGDQVQSRIIGFHRDNTIFF
jgi:hypothetical protein